MDDRERRGWEYHTLSPPRESTMKEAADPTEALNDLGADGWKLVDTVDFVGGGTKYLVLRRPAAPAEATDRPGAPDEPVPAAGG